MTKEEHSTTQPNELSHDREHLPAPVYCIESDIDNTVLVGIDVRKYGDVISWFDTVQERIMHVEEIIDSSGSHYVFKRSKKEGGQIYTLTPMTLATYSSVVKPRLLDGGDFTDEQSMIDAFLKTKETAW